MATQLQFLDYCENHNLPWHTDFVRLWVAELAITKDKTLAPKTLLQKVSHINMLTEMRPALIDGPAVTAAHQLKGSGVCYIPGVRNTILPPSFLLTLAFLEQPQLIHLAMQLQAMTGLRGGQMVLIIKAHLLTTGRMVVPPYKHTKHTTVVPTDHIPQWLLSAFVSYAKTDLTPILPWTGAQYRARFKQVTSSFRLPQASYSARHTFACVRRILGDPLPVISARLIHKQNKTLYNYLHPMPAAEELLVNSHTNYFIQTALKLQ